RQVLRPHRGARGPVAARQRVPERQDQPEGNGSRGGPFPVQKPQARGRPVLSSRLSPSPSSALNVWRATLFLFFRDIALLLGALALWTENPLLASLPAVGLALPQLLWCLDFLTGARISGMTSYMFDPRYSRF